MFTAAPADARARGTAIFAALFVASAFALTEVAWATGDGHKRGDHNARCAKHTGKTKTGAPHRHKSGRKGECKPTPPPPPAPKGKIVITKQTHPDHSTQAFTFTAPGLDADGFTLKDDDSATFENVAAGTYTVTENATPGWTLKRIVCEASGKKPKDDDHKGHDHGSKDDDHKDGKGDGKSWKARKSGSSGGGDHSSAPVTVNGNAVTINLAAGQTVSCTFKNKPVPPPPPAKIVVRKVTVPAGATASFAFTAPTLDADGFSLTDGQSATFDNLAAGTYVVTEGSLDGWTLQTLACADPTANTTTAGAVATIDVAAGETVTCTFTNAPTPAPTVTPPTPEAPTPPGPTSQPPTSQPPTSGVSPQPPQAGVTPRASLGAPRQCVRTDYPVTISGRPISSISFSVNGRHVKTVRANRRTRVRTVLTIRTGRVQRVVARVNFTSNAQPRSKTLRATVLKCQSVRAVLPSFTG
jgi:hypothetical protein